MSTFLAASTTSVPSGTVTRGPSIVSVTIGGPFGSGSGTGGHPVRRALVSERVLLVLAAEPLHRGHDHPARRVAEAAQAATALQALLDAVQDLQVDLAAGAGQDAIEGPHRPVAADAAGRALAARLVRVEAQAPVARAHDAVRVAHADHPAGARHRADAG